MKCDCVQADLKALVDKELGWLANRRVSRHLKSCPECERALRIMRELTDTLQETETVAPPKDFKTKVMAKIASEIQSSRRERSRVYRPERRFTRWAPAFAFAAGALAVLCANLVFHRTTTPSSMARDTTIMVVHLALNTSQAAKVEKTLRDFKPVSLRRTFPRSLVVSLQQKKMDRLIKELGRQGPIEMKSLGYAPPSFPAESRPAEPMVEIRIDLVTP